jgi:hypothetical protein
MREDKTLTGRSFRARKSRSRPFGAKSKDARCCARGSRLVELPLAPETKRVLHYSHEESIACNIVTSARTFAARPAARRAFDGRADSV